MRAFSVLLLMALSACASKGAPKVDCRGPLRAVNAALLNTPPSAISRAGTGSKPSAEAQP